MPVILFRSVIALLKPFILMWPRYVKCFSYFDQKNIAKPIANISAKTYQCTEVILDNYFRGIL